MLFAYHSHGSLLYLNINSYITPSTMTGESHWLSHLQQLMSKFLPHTMDGLLRKL